MLKLTPRLQSLTRNFHRDRKIPIIVEYKQRPNRQILNLSQRLGLDIKNVFKNIPMSAGTLSKRNLKNLSRLKNVRRLHFDEPIYTLPVVRSQKTKIVPLNDTVNAMNANNLHDRGIKGKGITIAVLDTGGLHNMFNHNVKSTFSVIENESVNKSNNPHGTWCSGCIAGKKMNATFNGTQFKVKGVAPKSKLIIGKCLSDEGGGTTSGIIRAMEIAADRNANIISMSLGSLFNRGGRSPDSQMVDALSKRGIILSIAAGNSGPAFKTIGSPAAARRAITIGSMSINGRTSTFSSRGPTLDGRIKPDFVTFGGNAITANEQILSAGKNNNWEIMAGTSMACPHASGAIALLLSAGMPQNTRITESVLAAGRRFKTPLRGYGNIDVKKSFDRMKTSVNDVTTYQRIDLLTDKFARPFSGILGRLRNII